MTKKIIISSVLFVFPALGSLTPERAKKEISQILYVKDCNFGEVQKQLEFLGSDCPKDIQEILARDLKQKNVDIYDQIFPSDLMSLSPDGKSLIRASRDLADVNLTAVELYDASDLNQIKFVDAFFIDSAVNKIQFNSTGRVAAISYNAQSLIWDLGKKSTEGINRMPLVIKKLSPDGNKALVSKGQEKNKLILVGLQKNWVAVSMIGGLTSISFSFSHNSTTTLVSQEVLKHDDEITSMAFSGDSNFVITGSKDKTARVWDDKTCKSLEQNNASYHVALNHDGTVWLTAGKKCAEIYDYKNKISYEYDYTDEVKGVLLSSDGLYAVVKFEKSCIVYVVGTGKTMEVDNGDELINLIEFSPDNQLIMFSDNIFSVVDLDKGKIKTYPIPLPTPINSLGFIPNKNQMLVLGSAGQNEPEKLYLYDFDKSTENCFSLDQLHLNQLSLAQLIFTKKLSDFNKEINLEDANKFLSSFDNNKNIKCRMWDFVISKISKQKLGSHLLEDNVKLVNEYLVFNEPVK